MKKSETITEADILAKLVGLEPASISLEAARHLLKLKFHPAAVRTIRRLLRENNLGTITATDRLLLDKYLHVGQLVDLLHAQAEVALRASDRGA